MSFEKDCCFAKGAKSYNDAIVGAMICTVSPSLCSFPNWNLVNDTKSQSADSWNLTTFCGWNAGSKISSSFHLIAFTFDVLGQRWSRRRWARWGTRWRISGRSLQVGEVHVTKSSCWGSKLVKLLLRYFLSRKCRFRSMKKMKNLRSEPTLQFIQPCWESKSTFLGSSLQVGEVGWSGFQQWKACAST